MKLLNKIISAMKATDEHIGKVSSGFAAKEGAKASLLDLKAELNTLKWMSSVEGDAWDCALKKVAEEIDRRVLEIGE